MKTPSDKRIIFTYYSHPMKDVKMRWKALLTFEPGSTDETEAVIRIVDGEGEGIAKGEFEFSGVRARVRDGEARIKCKDFAAGKHEQGIWLYRRGCSPIPGALTFE